MSTNKIIRQLRAEYPQTEIGYTSKGHIRLVLPNGRVVTASCTPSDSMHALRNVRADIKRKLRSNDND